MRHLLVCVIALLCVSSSIAQVWVRSESVPPSDILTVFSNQSVLFATTDTALFRSTDGGSTWHRTETRPPTNSAHYRFLSHNGLLYAGDYGGGVFVSTDNGDHWFERNNGLGGWAKNVVDFAVLGDSLYMASQGSGIFTTRLSTSDSWHEYNTGLTELGANAMVVSDNTLVASVGLYLFVRQRGAASWTEPTLDPAKPQVNVTALHVSGGHVYAGAGTTVYRGSSDGLSWTKVEIPFLNNLPVETLTSAGGRLFAGVRYRSEHFLCSTDDRGGKWEVRAHEFAWLYSLCVSGSRIWAGRSDGLWSAELSTWTDVRNPGGNVPATHRLDQNFPNPFNPSTTFPFSVGISGKVTLEVFDILGTRVATLMNGPMARGEFRVQWNADTSPSGVYFARLETPEGVLIRKLTLIR